MAAASLSSEERQEAAGSVQLPCVLVREAHGGWWLLLLLGLALLVLVLEGADVCRLRLPGSGTHHNSLPAWTS